MTAPHDDNKAEDSKASAELRSAHAPLWTRVQRLLDEREDPLDDYSVREYLDAHPEALEAFATWRARLRAVECTPRPTQTKQRAQPTLRLSMLAAAALAGCALGALGVALGGPLYFGGTPAPSDASLGATPELSPMPEFSDGARVRSSSASVIRLRRGQTRAHIAIEGTLVRTHIDFARDDGRHSARPAGRGEARGTWSPRVRASVAHLRTVAKSKDLNED